MGLADRVRQREAMERGEVPPPPAPPLAPAEPRVLLLRHDTPTPPPPPPAEPPAPPPEHVHEWVPDEVAGYATCACGRTARLVEKAQRSAPEQAPAAAPSAPPPPAPAAADASPPAPSPKPPPAAAPPQAPSAGDRVVGTITRQMPVSVPVTAREFLAIARHEAEALHNAIIDLAQRLGAGAPTIMLAAQMAIDTALRAERARAEREAQL